jgi:C1A family cysteine protease
MTDQVQPVHPNIRNIIKGQWIPDIPDHRDRLFTATRQATLPDHVNIIGIHNKIEDQGNLGSCTGNSSTSALEISIGTKRGFSRLFAYYFARAQRNAVSSDAGASIRDVMKGIMQNGVAYEQTAPYIEANFANMPSPQAIAEGKALVYRMWGFEYVSLNSLQDLKAALASGYPVTFGFSVPEWFTSPNFNNILRFPNSSEKIVGGHAVVAVGYDDRYKDKIIWVRNSWSKNWGINGYFKMTQDWFSNPTGMAGDMWVIRRNPNAIAPPGWK